MAAVSRSYEFWFAAYFLSKYGSRTSDSETAAPPTRLGTSTWKETYSLFYPVLGLGRTDVTFQRSLKNARDSYDATLSESGRRGWWQTQLPETAQRVVQEWSVKPEEDVVGEIERLLSRTTPKTGVLPKALLTLGVSKKRFQGRRIKNPRQPSNSSLSRTIIGQMAEELVFQHLKQTLGEVASTLRYNSMHGEKPGYDMSYTTKQGVLQAVEVKGTSAPSMDGFTITENERHAAETLGDRYTVMLVIGVPNNARLVEIRNPIAKCREGQMLLPPSEWDARRFSVTG